MRFIKALFLPAISLLSLNGSTPITIEAGFSLSPLIGTFTGTEDYFLDYSIDFDLSNTTYGLDVKYYRKNGNVLYSTFSGEVNSERKTLLFPIAGQINISPIKVVMKVSKGGIYSIPFFSGEATLEQPHYGNYVSTGGVITIPYVCFGISLNVITNAESYDFTDTNEFITIDSQSRLDLSEFTFSYSPRMMFKAKEMYLEIVDYENIYPNLVKADGNKTIRIPLSKTIVDRQFLRFSINKQMYVNQSTLEMSEVMLPGYTQTDSLYVPLSKQGKMQNNEINIYFHESGFDLSDIRVPLTFYTERNYFGFCDDSDYCIHGGIKQ